MHSATAGKTTPGASSRRWVLGAFGAMGGLQTNANDYAKWVTFLLSAWPPRDGADDGPVRRATVRELAQGSNFPRRCAIAPARTGTPVSRQSANYGMGMQVAIDEDLGFTVSHSGGYPGYGSHVLLLPDRGIGIFAFANRTYAGPSVAVWDAAVALNKAGLLGKVRELPISADLESAYRSAGAMYKAGDVTPGPRTACDEFPARPRCRGSGRGILRSSRPKSESARQPPPSRRPGALPGDFTWRCTHGRIKGTLALAPDAPPCSHPGVGAVAARNRPVIEASQRSDKVASSS